MQEEDLAFIINVGDGYDNFAEGQEPGSCTLMSGASGLWSSRSLDECLGAADSAIDDFKAHVICKMSSACPGKKLQLSSSAEQDESFSRILDKRAPT